MGHHLEPYFLPPLPETLPVSFPPHDHMEPLPVMPVLQNLGSDLNFEGLSLLFPFLAL